MNQPIRSYVLRQGRTTPAQRRAFDALYERFGIGYRKAPLDTASIFGRRAPLVVEIGSGMGETTAAIARLRPDTDFVAIEVHLPGVGALLKRVEAEGITNVRVIRHDAVQVLTHMIPDDSLAGVNLFFPDPWPKKRHHKRRILQAAFARLIATKLAEGGVLHAATDWLEYADHMLSVLQAEPLLANTSPDPSGFAARPDYRPLTKFERRGIALGHPVKDLLFRRIKVPRSASAPSPAPSR